MAADEATKPHALAPASAVRILSPAGPVDEGKLRRGAAELGRLGFQPRWNEAALARQGYFAGSAQDRTGELTQALEERDTAAIIAARGGYGGQYLLEDLDRLDPPRPKALVGFSDVTVLHALAWRRWRWVSFYGPMAAAGLDCGAGFANGYDESSFLLALTRTSGGWNLPLQGEALIEGEAEGRIAGGCLTLLGALVGTRWEPETLGAILLIEDCNMRPYQVDRALMHLKLAGKLAGVRGILLGDFPGCEPPADDGPTVREVASRVLGALGVPIVWGVPVGHTQRPLLTLPLGVRARLVARGEGRLDILEPTVAL